MSLSARQYNHLTEMGINLWRSKQAAVVEAPIEKKHLVIDFKKISQLSIFTDILQSLGLSLGEIHCEEYLINLGLFNWQFSDEAVIHFENNVLTTPKFNTIKETPELKAQLWKVFSQHNLQSAP